VLELVQNEFPYPRDLPAFELMLHISQSAPPKLVDDPTLPKPWSDAMKDFITQACVSVVSSLPSDCNECFFRLSMDAASRPTPKDLLFHPWIEGNMKHKINMARWISEVWRWETIHGFSTPNSG